MQIDINTLRIAATLLSFAAFIGICVWALSRRNASRFEEAAQLPFAHDASASESLQDAR